MRDKTKRKISNARSYAAHRDARLAAQAIYRATHRQEILDGKAVYRATYPEKVKETFRRSCKLGRLKRNATQAKWRATHPEKVKAWRDSWASRNLESNRQQQAKRRAVKRGALIIDAKAIIEWIKSWRFKKWVRCYWCNGRFSPSECEPDHIMPLGKGGEHSLKNIAISCWQCNRKKNDKSPDEWNQTLEQPRLILL